MATCKIVKTGPSPIHFTTQKRHNMVSDDSRKGCMTGMKKRNITGHKKQISLEGCSCLVTMAITSPFILLIYFAVIRFAHCADMI